MNQLMKNISTADQGEEREERKISGGIEAGGKE